MRSKQTGWILLSVLLFLHLTSLLGMESVQSSLLAQKTTNAQWLQQQTLLIAENVLQRVIRHSIEEPISCLIPKIRVDALLSKSMIWWEGMCLGNVEGVHFYYVVEALGENPCARIRDQHAYYYRITLLFLGANKRKKWLQTTMVKPDVPREHCALHSYDVVPGKLSWQLI